MPTRLLSRRQLLAAGAGTLGGVALASCGSSAPPPPPATVSYRSRPDLVAPRFEVEGPAGVTGPGYLCLTLGQPMLVDNAGQPVWIHPVGHPCSDLRVQNLGGRPVLTWWQGRLAPYGVGTEGQYVVLDGSYRQVMTVKGRLGLAADLHEFLITEGGVAYFTAYQPVTRDLRPVGGPARGHLLDSTVQGVDLATGQLVFDWRGLDHLALEESHATWSATAKFPYDPVHLNSIDTNPDGTLLISARNTWALYKVDPASGRIVWRLGGKRSDFELGPGVRFAFQHDARWRADSTMTLFDNEGDPRVGTQSRGLLLGIDEPGRRATLLRQYLHPEHPIRAGSQGSLQVLPGGDLLVGWGSEPYATEYRPDGTLVLDVHFSEKQSYRAVRFPWTGQPTEPPAVAVGQNQAGRLAAFASWNGSTETASWEALGGPSPGALATVGAAPKTGFETSVALQGRPRFVAVRAFDDHGSPLATSKTIRA